MPEQKWVAVDKVASRAGRTLYYQGWTGIGPRFTPDPKDAHLFDSEEAARRGVPHPLVIVEAQPAPEEALT